jgi:hypothetical protein
MKSRKARPLVIALMSVAVVSFPALAAKPTIVYFDASPPFTLPAAVTGCNFDVLATNTNSKTKLATFVDQNGDTKVIIFTGVNEYLLTNLSTGKSLTFNSSAPSKLYVQPDNTIHAIVTGPALLVIAPGAVPQFPSFAFSKGRLDMLITQDFVTLQLYSSQGTVQDICALLE